MLRAARSCSAMCIRLCSISSRYLQKLPGLWRQTHPHLKALMVSYMSFAWQTFLEHLRSFASKDVDDGKLWLSILRTISKSITADEDRSSYCNCFELPPLPHDISSGFWRNDKLRQLQPLAIQQVPVATRINTTDSKAVVSDCLIAMLSVIDDDVMAKSLNLGVLMYSRSEEARVRWFSVACAEQLWYAHGNKLLGARFFDSFAAYHALTYVVRLCGGDCNVHRRGSGRRERSCSQGCP